MSFNSKDLTVQVRHIYVSPVHIYVGHHGREAGMQPMLEVSQVECLADQGLQGDRYAERGIGHSGQITFFQYEVYQELCDALCIHDKLPSAFRRNVITQGVDLNQLIAREFFIQGIRFFGTEECAPCYWMNLAFGKGAEAILKGRGGLRANILSNGTLYNSAQIQKISG